MAYSVILSDGTTDYEFVYDAASQADYKMYYGMRVESGETRAQWHQPDDDTRQLIRLVDDPGTIFITQTVKGGAAWDNVINNIIPIKRLVNGRHQQAARYQLEGDVNKVCCRIQIDGATNYTDYEVIYGEVDDSGSYYKSVDVANTEATGVIVALNVKPYGEGAAITLRNDLPSSPHCLEDSNSDGLPDGWTEVNNPTTSLYTTSYVVGGQCMRVDTSAAAQGVYIRTTITASANLAAFVWCSVVGSAQIAVTLRSNNGANTIDSGVLTSTDANGISDKSVVVNGFTWYRVPLSGAASAHTNAEIRLTCNTSGAQLFFIDAAYLMEGTLTIPDAFMSCADIYTRYDPVTANPERINYVDVWGVPGDSDALVDTTITGTTISGSPAVIIVGKDTQGTVNPADRIHWIDSVDVDVSIIGGSTATVADANRAGGSYLRYTADASIRTVNWLADIGTVWADYTRFAQIPHRVYAIARTSNVNTTLTLSSFFSFFAVVEGAGTFENANTWELVDCGLVTSIDKTILDYRTEDTSYIQITGTLTATSATADLDAVFLVPAVDDGFLVGGDTTITTSTTQHLLGSEETYMSSAASRIGPTLGSVWTIKPGNKMTRYIYSMISAANAHVLTNAFTVAFTITPRTRHLLGTE